MVHTVIEVMRMDKKFIAAVAVCFVALVGVATGNLKKRRKHCKIRKSKHN